MDAGDLMPITTRTSAFPRHLRRKRQSLLRSALSLLNAWLVQTAAIAGAQRLKTSQREHEEISRPILDGDAATAPNGSALMWPFRASASATW